MKKTTADIIYLIFKSLNNQQTEKERIDEMNIEELYRISKFNSISVIITYAIESAGINDQKFQKEKNLAIRNIILLDAERKQICKFFEENIIWYMPLKGVYMKEYYPEIGMRQMCDNDILIDSTRIEEIHEYMLNRGYEFHSKKTQNDYEYLKHPCYNFEMHKSLFAEFHETALFDYYKNIHEKLIRKSEDSFEYRFTDEDFYIYMIAHEYKHFSNGGTGLRSLVDTYVYLNKFSDSMNWDYICEQCKKLEIDEFEEKSRKLALKVFSSTDFPELNEDEEKMLDYYLRSGTYGTILNSVDNKINKIKKETGISNKYKYIVRRIFPNANTYKHYYPFFYTHKFLLPIGWAYRLLRGIFCKNRMIKAEIKAIKNIPHARK